MRILSVALTMIVFSAGVSSMLRNAKVFAAVLAAAIAGGSAAASESATYYISMRGLTVEAAATFVVVEAQASATRTAAIAGCDELTYYATPADAASVSAARAAGELVQLHRAGPGQTAQTSSIMCVLDAAGGA